MGACMHHILVVCKVVGFGHYIGNNGRMFRKKSLIINFFPFELLAKLCERLDSFIHCLTTVSLDRLACTLSSLLYWYAYPWEAKVLQVEAADKIKGSV